MQDNFCLTIYKDADSKDNYKISNYTSNKVWIQNSDGEGGTFDISELYKVVEAFFIGDY